MGTSYDEYMDACWDYLEGDGVGEPPLPSGLGPEDLKRAQRWIRWLVDSRNAMDLVQAVKDLGVK